MPKKAGVRFPRAVALSMARYLLIKLDPFVNVSAISGSLRRGLPDCGDVDILIIPKHRLPSPVYVQDAVCALCVGVPQIIGDDLIIADFRLPDGGLIPVNIFMTAPENWGAALHYTTGSRDYNVSVRSVAKARGFTADQYGVWVRSKRGTREDYIDGSGETEVAYCRAIGIPWLPPEARINHAFEGERKPRPTWCVDHTVYDFCKKERSRVPRDKTPR